jgi:methyl coenzyme M reductase subunit D
MKIVIDIPEETFKYYVTLANKGEQIGNLERIILDGKPLPEHHGLIDRLELSDHIKNRLIQTAMNNMETILPYSKVCTDIVDNRIDIWIDEVKTIIEGSDSE